MDKNKRIIIMFTLLFILVFIASVYIIKSSDQNELKKFNFSLNYGITAKNEINTFSGIYTKDMIGAPSVTTPMKLTDREMKEIYTEMKNIDILGYPDDPFPEDIYRETHEQQVVVTPSMTYILSIDFDGVLKSITWKDNHNLQDEKAVKFRKLMMKIINIVENREEYKMLPPAVGAYD